MKSITNHDLLTWAWQAAFLVITIAICYSYIEYRIELHKEKKRKAVL